MSDMPMIVRDHPGQTMRLQLGGLYAIWFREV
jgi:hypothetical protein